MSTQTANLRRAEVLHTRLRRSVSRMHQAEKGVFLDFCEMHRTRLHRELGYASIQAYASDKLGFSSNRVNRYLRLMNDLDRMPQVRATLHSGRLGWT